MFSIIYELNAIIVSVCAMVILSLCRVSIVFSLILAALIGGVIAKIPIKEVISIFTQGLGAGATIALSYAILGAFAVALARSGIAELLAGKAIKILTGKEGNAKNNQRISLLLLGILLVAAMSSQNVIPVHIAFIPILIPPLLVLMNKLNLDRRLVACVLTFGLVGTYIFIPVGFGAIFMYDLLLYNLNVASQEFGIVLERSLVVKSMALPFIGMIVGLLYSYFVSYRKPRQYKTIALDPNETYEHKFKKLSKLQISLIMVALLGTVVVQLIFDSMILGGMLGFAILSLVGVFEWQEQDHVFTQGMRMMALVGFIMISASGFAAVMKATGHVSTLVDSSMNVIGDNKALASLAMLLVGLFITLGIGSSFSTIPIITIIFVPIAFKLGFTPAGMVALVGTAAALGDAGSPASDSTLGPTSGLNVDGQHNHMWDTVVPTFIHYNIPLVIFGWIASMIL
ncbi:Na+/H+ antiporter family protein [Thorsellia kenyensis]|uniref:Na+/H+ antiporter family protein n=1 Tax=Thorsellia kenyensis TaxID=1549888 RepID=A0ABV6C9Q1_9GAMM